MRHLRLRAVAKEGSQVILQGGVAHGAALVLTHVFLPAGHDEHLDEALRRRGIAIDGPAHGAGAPAGPAHPPHGSLKLVDRLRRHLVGDRHEHGPTGIVNGEPHLRREHRRGPEIQVADGTEPPAQAQQRCQRYGKSPQAKVAGVPSESAR